MLKSLFFIPYEHSGILQPLLGVGWTLNYEMFFYLLFWIAIKINHSKRGKIVTVVSVILVLINSIFELPLPFSFWMDAILLEFSYGIVLFLLYEKYSDKVVIENSIVSNLICWTVTIIGAVCMEIVLSTDISRGIGVGLIGMIIVGTVLICGKNMKIPNIILYIAEISYVLYLIHIYPVRLTETIIKCNENYKLLLAIVSISVAIICAVIWNQIVEQRVQRWLRKKVIKK